MLHLQGFEDVVCDEIFIWHVGTPFDDRSQQMKAIVAIPHLFARCGDQPLLGIASVSEQGIMAG